MRCVRFFFATLIAFAIFRRSSQQEAEGAEEPDLVADDLKDGEDRDCHDHPRDAPEEFAGDQADDGKQRAEIDLVAHHQWADDVELGELDKAIAGDDPDDHMDAAALA